MQYEGDVYRPPSEAYSLIVQATLGCSHNGCTFCGMYKNKRFRIRPLEDVLSDFRWARSRYAHVEKIFIADGDALIRSMEDWLAMLACINALFPECRTVTCYASPKSIQTKTDEELKELNQNGLNMVYVGLESGCDEVLLRVNKGATASEIVTACQRVKQAGIRLSVTAISGLGSEALSSEHAVETARALSLMKPDFIGLLTLHLHPHTRMYAEVQAGEFQLLNTEEICRETYLLLEHLDAEGTVFRSNHASNAVVLKGTLNADRERMMQHLKLLVDSGRAKTIFPRWNIW